jgi:O-acetyl-ADP-ribose deacetylase (regulator of RNase III)
MSKIELVRGSVVEMEVDAIVNAANSQMLGCFVPLHRCIDNAIHSAAGIQLRLECARIVEGDEPTGSARITGGYNLPSRHVIHTVGPIIPNGVPTAEQERQLASSYRSCLSLADEKGLADIVFCCISTGEYRFPNQRAARIAVDTVRQYMEGYRRNTSLKTVVFNVYKDIDYDAYRAIFGKG